MASWGRKSDFQITGTGTVVSGSNILTGANTVFTEEVEVRNVIDLDGDRFVVLKINSDTELEVAPLASANTADEDILLSESPKYLSVAQATEEVTYVTVSEAQDSENRELGIKTPGWTLYKEYGNGRKRVETLVAMRSAT
jgi:hypothetical protein